MDEPRQAFGHRFLGRGFLKPILTDDGGVVATNRSETTVPIEISGVLKHTNIILTASTSEKVSHLLTQVKPWPHLTRSVRA